MRRTFRVLSILASVLLCLGLTVEWPASYPAQVRAQAGAQTVTLTVTDGYDSKLRKLLSQDKKVDTVQSNDNERWETDARYFTAFQFSNALPLTATIQSVRVFIEHHEEDDFTTGGLRWEVGTGDIRNPTALASQTPPVLRGRGAEARVEWNATGAITTPAMVNDLKFIVRNSDSRDKKTKTDLLYVVITYASTPTSTPTSTPALTATPTPTPVVTPSATPVTAATVTPAPLASISLAPSPITLAVGATQLFTATGTDASGNTFENMFVSWVVLPGVGGIESTGPFTALVRAGDTPGTYPGSVVAAVGSIAGAADVQLAPRPPQFTPARIFIPVIANEVAPNIDNHTACTALAITPPATVTQPANDAFNIYRFVAAEAAYNVTLSNYASSGKLVLYRIVDDMCAASGTLSVSLVKEAVISTPTFQTTLDALLPGASYLLAVNTTGALTNQAYTIAVGP